MADIKVIEENETGRNTKFAKGNWHTLSRAKLVSEIEAGLHPHMHIRIINWIKTPVTNPNNSESDNLG